jgi:hypothetical protein
VLSIIIRKMASKVDAIVFIERNLSQKIFHAYFLLMNLQLTNTIYKRQTTNDNCHSDQILGFWFHKAIVTNHICKIIMHN